MSTIIKIAWKNVGRNKLRSAVVIISVAIGLWGGVFSMALFNGLNEQRTESTISTITSHVQVHDSMYLHDADVKYVVQQEQAVIAFLSTDERVKKVSERMILTGMGSSAQGGFGIQVSGIDPENEKQVTNIHTKIIDGTYLGETWKNQVVIGKKLADKLKLKIRSKLILTFQDAEGDLTAGAFRVAGIYKSNNSVYDQLHVFVKQDDLIKVYGEKRIQEIAIILHDIDDSKLVEDEINAKFPANAAQYWGKVAPEIGYADQVMGSMLYIFVVIILMAMAFGILNSMMMAVLERRHELGMLMCIGMSKGKVFGMIMWETIFIAMIGGPLGLFFTVISVGYTKKAGIDLSQFGEGLSSIGIDTIVYPDLSLIYYVNITVMIVVTAILSAIYPARKAIAYNPSEAIRSL